MSQEKGFAGTVEPQVHRHVHEDLTLDDGIDSAKGGTFHDVQDMWRVGRKQELDVSLLNAAPALVRNLLTIPQRNFRFISILGFCTVLMQTWESVLL